MLKQKDGKAYAGLVVYTQRVEVVEKYGERRDCADQRIADWICACGFLPIPLPNRADTAAEIAEELKPAGILLTGGNSLCAYGGNAPERDDMDRRMIALSVEQGIPLFGFCRGMQSILDYFGNRLEEVQGHVAVRHRVSEGRVCREVNSYHNQACKHLEEDCGLVVTSRAEDGVIESVRHRRYPIAGVMWHPEREERYRQEDIHRLQRLFGERNGKDR